jgi:hypothetical protein
MDSSSLQNREENDAIYLSVIRRNTLGIKKSLTEQDTLSGELINYIKLTDLSAHLSGWILAGMNVDIGVSSSNCVNQVIH